jgi:NDP-sugar pyrophosphorylase family protein
MQCVILAGGLGTRMAALAPNLPKALIPVRGQPFAHHQLRLLVEGGMERVIYCIGHRGEDIRRYVGDGSRWGLAVDYVDEGEALRGTAGALRLALDAGALPSSFFVLYGDSYLPIDYRGAWRVFEACGRPGLMTVFRNEQRWDTSNVVLEGGLVTLYDKRRRDPRPEGMVYIDYGLTALRRDVIDARVLPDQVVDLADVYHRMSLEGDLAGLEVRQRFYEIGSPAGLEELERYLDEPSRPPGR